MLSITASGLLTLTSPDSIAAIASSFVSNSLNLEPSTLLACAFLARISCSKYISYAAALICCAVGSLKFPLSASSLATASSLIRLYLARSVCSNKSNSGRKRCMFLVLRLLSLTACKISNSACNGASSVLFCVLDFDLSFCIAAAFVCSSLCLAVISIIACPKSARTLLFTKSSCLSMSSVNSLFA